ncbi:MAG: hybrid sensor histidine kinase/response regulator [SAR324 cluster bacterium]|nr:hybrid sensor histidine kinase/response regulator [SAR324 cluster bacterium]
MIKVLIVDDEPQVIQLLETLISDLGFAVCYISRPEFLFQILKDEVVALILMDVHMPQIDGITLLKQLKAHPVFQEIPVIMLTSDTREDLLVQCFDNGAADFINKPVQKSVLSSRVKAAVTTREHMLTIRKQNLSLHRINMVSKQLNQKLKTHIGTLEQSNQDKTNLLSVISHDLRGPFTAMSGFSEMLLEELNTQGSSQALQLATMLDHAIKKEYILLEELLAFSKLQIQGVIFSYEPVVLYEVVNQSIQQEQLQLKQQTLRNQVDENMVVSTDISLLKIVLRNLLTNAMKFTPEEGVITVSATKTPTEFQVSVADTGVGIAPENQEYLFNFDVPYHTMGTNHEDGCGLGLSLCNELLKKAQGHLWVESQVGQGATFYFSIPCDEASIPSR